MLISVLEILGQKWGRKLSQTDKKVRLKKCEWGKLEKDKLIEHIGLEQMKYLNKRKRPIIT